MRKDVESELWKYLSKVPKNYAELSRDQIVEE